MAKEQYLMVESIKNPSVKRLMNVNSFKMNQKKWRLQNGQTLEQATKKKDVEPVVEQPVKVIEPETFGNTDEDLLKKPETPFVKVEDEPVSEIDSLRAAYTEKTGKKPDGRWNVERLTKELNAD